MASKGFLFYLLCVLPVAMAHNTNGTVNGSVVLSCVLKTSGPIDPARLRFHWEEVNSLSRLYVFEKGKLMPERASKTYRNRTTASVQDMRSGNISVTLNNLTLEDDGSSFWAFAVLFEEHDASLRQDFEKICQTTLHVAEVGLQLSGWVIALIVVGVVVLLAVLLAVYVMWKKYVGQRDLSGWVIAGLVVRGVDVIAVVLLDVYAIWKKHVEQQDLSDWATAGLVVAVVLLAAAVVFDVYVIWKKLSGQQGLSDGDIAGFVARGVGLLAVAPSAVCFTEICVYWKKYMGHQDISPGIIIGSLVCLVVIAAAALLDLCVIWKKRVGQRGLSGGDIAGFVVRGVHLLAVVSLPVAILVVYSGWTRYVVQLGITIWDITFIVFGFALLAVVLVVCLILKICGNRNQRPATANDSAAAVRADASPTRSTDVVPVPLMEC